MVRLPLVGFPSFTSAGVNPLLAQNHNVRGFTIDGEPVLLRPYRGTARPRLVPDEPVYDLEFVARDVPPLGWRRLLLERAEPSPEQEDDGRWVAEIPDLAGVMAYGATTEEARAKVEALALRTLADRLDHGETIPELGELFVAA